MAATADGSSGDGDPEANGGAAGREVRARPTATSRRGRSPPGSPRLTAGRALERARALPAWAWAGAVVVGLAVSWVVAVASGVDAGGSRHLFYVPIVLSALRFGVGVTAVVGMVATVLAGPAAVPGPVETWLPRGPFYVGVGVLVAAFAATIHREHAREAALLERERELATQQALLVQSVSHEFRTPLTVINGAATTLAGNEHLVAPQARRLVGSLVNASARLNDLVSVVLVAAEAMHDETHEPQVAVAIPALVGEIADALSGQQGLERVRVRTEADAATLVTVRSHLRLALRCIIDNALKFSEHDQRVDVSVWRDDEHLVIEVRDRGPGVAPEAAEELLRPYGQDDRATTGGLGMGLFSARRLIERLGGDLRLLERPGSGLVVRIHLPQRRAADLRGVPRRP